MLAFRTPWPPQYAGADFVLPFAIVDDDGASVDLSESVVSISVRLNGAEVLDGDSTDGTISIIEPSSCVARFTATQTDGLRPGIYTAIITTTDSETTTRVAQRRFTVRGEDE